MWAGCGDIITVITFLEPEGDVFKLDPQVRRIAIGGANKSGNAVSAMTANLKRIRRLREAISASRSQTVISFVGATNVLTILATRGIQANVVVSERNDPSRQSLGTLWNFLRHHTYKLANLITANSQHTVYQLSAQFPHKKIRWVPNPIRISKHERHFELGRPYIVAAGRLHPQKGFDILLHAFARFYNSYPLMKLLILGEGDERAELESLIHSLQIGSAVDLVGFVKDPFLYYRGAVFMAHPARYEGLPNVVLEAMSVGVPVVVTDTQPGILDFVKHETTGLVVPSESAASLAGAMRRLCDDESLRTLLGRAGQDAIRPCLPEQAIKTWDNVIGNI